MLRARNMHLWLGTYIRDRLEYRLRERPGAVDVYFCFADHYEPYGYGATRERARARVQRWVEHFPPAARRHRDSDGRHPVHSFFYPAEEYDPELLDQLRTICGAGIGDVELHLHHDNDTAGELGKALDHVKKNPPQRPSILRPGPDDILIV